MFEIFFFWCENFESLNDFAYINVSVEQIKKYNEWVKVVNMQICWIKQINPHFLGVSQEFWILYDELSLDTKISIDEYHELLKKIISEFNENAKVLKILIVYMIIYGIFGIIRFFFKIFVD